MKISRRDFLLVTAGLTAGCQTIDGVSSASTSQGRIVNAGPATNYAADGVYSNFRNQGFFLVRQGDNLFALSAICTHRKCALVAEPNHSFYCKCHGSTFDPAGHVTKGPAKLHLPKLPAQINKQGQLMVSVPAT